MPHTPVLTGVRGSPTLMLAGHPPLPGPWAGCALTGAILATSARRWPWRAVCLLGPPASPEGLQCLGGWVLRAVPGVQALTLSPWCAGGDSSASFLTAGNLPRMMATAADLPLRGGAVAVGGSRGLLLCDSSPACSARLMAARTQVLRLLRRVLWGAILLRAPDSPGGVPARRRSTPGPPKLFWIAPARWETAGASPARPGPPAPLAG